MTGHPSRQRLWAVVIALIALAAGVGAGLVLGRGHHPETTEEPSASAIDIGFAQDMSAHHQQAVAMCDMMPLNVAPDVRGLVNEIRLTQWREIGQMMGWLQMLDAPLDNPHPMDWMGSTDSATGEQHHDTGTTMAAMPNMATPEMPHMAASMPGMANSRELTTLSTSSGRQAEIMFLQLMIRHHQGGVDMAANAARRAVNRNVKEAALEMVKDQTDEIQLMMVMLDQRGGATLPYPTR
jgi:uncharacterized protein (DUF305 family)